MELTQLKYFYAAAECGHITKAAEKLHIAQPALTQSIRRLENELGVKLFVRQGRSIALSRCGEYLFKQLGGVLKTLDRVPCELLKIAELEEKTIRVNILAASLLITELIIEYKRLHPDIKFFLHQSADADNCDCTISANLSGNLPIVPKSSIMKSYSEEIKLAVPADSEYSKLSSIKLSDTKENGFISLSGSKPFHSICETLCRMVGFTPDVVFESDSPSTVRGLIGAGMGVGFWPAYTWGSINSDNVVLLPISYPDCRREITLICHNTESLAACEFFEYLCTRLEEISVKASGTQQ